MDLSNLMRPFGVTMDLVEAVMENPARHAVRRASVMRGYYADEAALERLIAAGHDPLHYETFEMDVPEEPGQLLFGLSRLVPGLVGDECFMTKGHYHTVLQTAEVYLGLRGRGLLLLKTPPDDGRRSECVAEPIWPGRLVYVPPCWAHRSINTGDEPLVTLFVYPGEAGHNYGDIETEGFPKRVFRIGGREVIR
jgi:glucose-6-phosphate isomerase